MVSFFGGIFFSTYAVSILLGFAFSLGIPRARGGETFPHYGSTIKGPNNGIGRKGRMYI